MKSKCWISDDQKFSTITDNNCVPQKGKLRNLIFGDSHSAHLLPGLKEQFPELEFTLVACDSCDFSEEILAARPNCRMLYDLVHEMDLSEVDNIIIGTRVSQLSFIENIKKVFIDISKRTSAKIYYVGPVPFYNNELMDKVLVAKSSYVFQIFPSLGENIFQTLLASEQFAVDKRFKEELKSVGVQYLSSLDFFCPDGKICRHMATDGFPILIDQTHMTVQASADLIQYFKQSKRLILN